MSITNLSVVTSGNKTFATMNIVVKFSPEEDVLGFYSKNDDGTFEPCDDPIKALKEKVDSSIESYFDRFFPGTPIGQDFDEDETNYIQVCTLSNFAEGRLADFKRTPIPPDSSLDIKSFFSDRGGIGVHIESIRGSSAPIDIPTSPSKELGEWKRKLLAEEKARKHKKRALKEERKRRR